MFSRKLSLGLGSLVLSLVACSADPNPGDDGGVGGTVGAGGTGAGAGGGPAGGSGTGGGAAGGAFSGGSASGGALTTGGAGTDTGGSAAGGSAAGGSTGGDGGNTGGGENGTGGGGGGDVGPGPSDIPPAPGPDNVPRPSGTPGDITVLDWAGFPASVTYSFDDNDGSQLTYYEQMKAIGGRYTFYLVTSNFGVAISDPRWKAIHEDGNEIGNHTATHPAQPPDQGTATSIINEATSAITSAIARPWTMAAPNGHAIYATATQGLFFINRGVSPSNPVRPLDSSNPFQLNCYIPSTGQAASAYNNNIDSALSQKGWVIYVIHGINPGTSHTFQPVSWDGLKGAIEYAKSKNVWIDTMENIGSYWLGQKEFAKAMTQTNGSSKTWTWTLPDKFPTGKYLRVKVDGGTLSQGGKPLTWDPHGYYEISLDEKSVTLEP